MIRRTLTIFFILAGTFWGTMALFGGEGVLVKTDEDSYELILPLGLEEEALYIPSDNPLTPEKVALGKQLFFDKRLSLNNSVACASCHNPRFGFTDGQPVSIGIKGGKGKRSAPTIVNRVFSLEQFWDGGADDLEAQALGPVTNPLEMGFTHEGVVVRLRGIKGYRERFNKVFSSPELTIEHVGKAIAAFERTVLSGNSPFDRFEAGNTTAMSQGAQRGLDLFRDKAKCDQCHSGFNFTDEDYHNIGMGMDRADPDLGRYLITNREADRGAFKTPTLREVATNAPYFHDGSAKTLEEVVEFYDKGGIRNPQLSNKIKPLGLTQREKTNLVEFMMALTGEIPLEVLAPELPE